MARLLFGNLAVELQWEPLLGLSKEADEVRELAGRRGAKQYLVLQNALGVRVAGLASLAANARKSQVFALAGLLRVVSDDPNLLFLHSDPDDPDRVLFIAIHDGKPAQDRAIAREAALDAARQFIQEVGTGVTILGDIDDELLAVTRHVNLEDIVTSLTDEEKAGCRLLPLPGKQLLGAVVILAIMGAMGGGVWWWMADQERQAQELAQMAAAQPDPLQEFRGRQEQAMQSAAMDHGAAYAQAMQQTIAQLPREAGSWQLDRAMCKDGVCELSWKRHDGGTFKSLMEARPRIEFQDMGSAIERVSFLNGKPPREVKPIPSRDFYLAAGVRMQELEDLGTVQLGDKAEKLMAVALGKMEPLVPLPPALKNRAAAARQIIKGSWAMQGHLAFVDSVPGLMRRVGNMTIDEMAVTINDKKPEFTAKGNFYVQ
ncbi:type 4b pilus protein PilO2 [Chromobacterium vaccinii]|uniref:type 4b pilus protein PilO2 n=1 Tax=Chromobacterium vaccinii TaxID=1108595 RepID=UPI003C78130C